MSYCGTLELRKDNRGIFTLLLCSSAAVIKHRCIGLQSTHFSNVRSLCVCVLVSTRSGQMIVVLLLLILVLLQREIALFSSVAIFTSLIRVCVCVVCASTLCGFCVLFLQLRLPVKERRQLMALTLDVLCMEAHRSVWSWLQRCLLSSAFGANGLHRDEAIWYVLSRDAKYQSQRD